MIAPAHRTRAYAAIALAAALAAGCAPKAPPLTGAIVPARLPATELPPVHRKLVFRWSYADDNVKAKGEGAARIAPPDSVRLDLFIRNDAPAGHAILIGDSLTTPGDHGVRDYLPPEPLLWAALGRLTVPAAPDTAARVDGDTLRVEIGRGPAWRATFLESELRRVELVDGGRIQQWVARTPDGHISYVRTRARRTLEITITRVDTVPSFDAAIWQH